MLNRFNRSAVVNSVGGTAHAFLLCTAYCTSTTTNSTKGLEVRCILPGLSQVRTAKRMFSTTRVDLQQGTTPKKPTNGTSRRKLKKAVAEVPVTFKQGKTEFCWQTISNGDGADHGKRRSGGGDAARNGASSHVASGKEKGAGDVIAGGGSSSELQIPRVIKSENTQERMRSFGMPRGYPHTVATGYARFFYISVCSGFIGNFATAIATQKLLVGFFSDSTPAIWMIKDLAPSLFAAFIANFVASYELRPKFWLIVSAVLSQIAVVCDLFIPSLVAPEHFLYAAVLTSIIKQSAVLMYFVSRASVIQHFSINQNLGEITKKFNSVGMISYTLATACGIGFTTFVTSLTAQTVAVLSCGLTTIFLAYLTTKHIAFRQLNPLTTQLIVRWFIRSGYSSAPNPHQVNGALGSFGKLKPSTLPTSVLTSTNGNGKKKATNGTSLASRGPIRSSVDKLLATLGSAPGQLLANPITVLDALEKKSAPTSAQKAKAEKEKAPETSTSSSSTTVKNSNESNGANNNGSGAGPSPSFTAEEQVALLDNYFVINPPIEATYVTSKNLAEALAVTGVSNAKFTLGVWKVNQRYGSRSLSARIMRSLPPSVRRTLFGRSTTQRQLVLFVQKDCELKQLLVALLISQAALLKHGNDFPRIELFIREAMRNQKTWTQRAELLLLHLDTAGWDSSTHIIDMIEHRLVFNRGKNGAANCASTQDSDDDLTAVRSSAPSTDEDPQEGKIVAQDPDADDDDDEEHVLLDEEEDAMDEDGDGRNFADNGSGSSGATTTVQDGEKVKGPTATTSSDSCGAPTNKTAEMAPASGKGAMQNN